MGGSTCTVGDCTGKVLRGASFLNDAYVWHSNIKGSICMILASTG